MSFADGNPDLWKPGYIDEDGHWKRVYPDGEGIGIEDRDKDMYD